MGVPTTSNNSADYYVNRPRIIGNTSEAEFNNPAGPEAPSAAHGSHEDAAPAVDVESLNSFFRNNQNNKNIPEILWLKAAKQIRNVTVVGAAMLLLLSIKEVVEKNNFEAALCFLSGVAIIFLSIFGNRRRDWRLIYGVAIVAALVAIYSVVDGILTAIETAKTVNLSDGELAKLGYASRVPVLSIGILDCVFCVFSTVYWGLVAYLHGKFGQIMIGIAARDNQQPASGMEATADFSGEGKDAGIGRDLTRAGTFAELV